jgi:hypothetical protein
MSPRRWIVTDGVDGTGALPFSYSVNVNPTGASFSCLRGWRPGWDAFGEQSTTIENFGATIGALASFSA